jgi:hypothetical protein
MKIKLLTSSFILLMLSSCIDDTETTAASQTAVVAQPPASVGSSGLSGQTITFNPTLVFSADGSKIDYQNNTAGNYPTGEFTNLVIGEAVEGDRLIVSITVGGEKIDLGFSFTDRGGEGYIDEAVLDLVEVNDEEKELPAKVTIAIAAGTVRNENVTAESLPDLTGAPTVDEWNKYLTGTGLLVTDTTDGSLSVVQFSSSTEATIYHLTGHDYAGTSDSFSYIYTKLDENTGTLDMTEYYVEEDEGPWYGQNIKDVGQVKLIWSSDEDATFYNGQWSDVQGAGVYTNLDTGEEIVSTSSPSSGTFGVVSNVSIYIEQNKQTASTGN